MCEHGSVLMQVQVLIYANIHIKIFPLYSFAPKPALSFSTLINTLPQCIITHGTSLSLA